MTAFVSLQNVSFDLLYCISESLSLEDIVNLSRTCKRMRSCLLSEDTLLRRIVEQHLRNAPETLSYPEGFPVDSRRVVEAVITRREAYAQAKPKWVMTAAFGSANFLLNQGTLVYLSEGSIRLLNVHEPSTIERTLHLTDIMESQFRGVDSEVFESIPNSNTAKLNLLNYCDDILVCLCQVKEPFDEVSAWLIILDLSTESHQKLNQFPVLPMLSVNKLVVRHNRSPLVYGTHSIDEEGSREWCFRTFSLKSQKINPNKISPKKFTGCDIDSTVTFALYKDHFYAVSSQRLLEGIDYTSCYHCVRFPLEDPSEKTMKVQKKVWRRQHTEGPINDLWSDLRLRVDEKTGDLIIIEARREWLSGGSTSRRTYYIKPLSPEFLGQASSVSSTPSTGSPTSSPSSSPYLSPIGGNLSLLNLNSSINSRDQPQDEYDRRRLPRHVHTGDTEKTIKTFALSDTKHRTYNPGANSWLDLVDDKQLDSRTYTTNQRLRIRVGSRKLEPPRKTEDGILAKDPETGEDFEDGMEEKWDDSAAPVLWPPVLGAQDNHDPHLPADDLSWINEIMNPAPPGMGMKQGDIRALSDESCLVYSVPARVGGRIRKALIVVGFKGNVELTSNKRKFNELHSCSEVWSWERARWMGIAKYWNRDK